MWIQVRSSAIHDNTYLLYSVFGSEPFEFVVNDQPIYIHKGLIKKVSRPLERLISNGMSEAQQGRAVLHDETVGTFTRFTHWAYAGFYDAGEFSKRLGMEARQEVDERMDEGVFIFIQSAIIGFTLAALVVLSAPTPIPRRVKKPHTYSDSYSLPTKKEALKEAFLKL